MKALYRAYCRSCTQANCAPYVMLGCAVIVILLAFGVSSAGQHVAQLIMIGRDIAAGALTGLAAVIGVRACRAVAAATGSHYSYRIRVLPVPAPGHLTAGESGDGTPVTVPVPVRAPAREGQPAFTYTLHEPLEHVPGKSDLITPLAADLAEMGADADALADDSSGIVVGADGAVYELIGGEEA
jgi:hypothetical protein